MKDREVITLMHKLFYGDIDKSDGYRHVFTNDELDPDKFNDVLDSYIETDITHVYIDSQNAFECQTNKVYEAIKMHFKTHRIRLASPDYVAKIITEPSGVMAGNIKQRSITNRSTTDAPTRGAR